MIEMTMMWYGNLCGKKRRVRSYGVEVGTTSQCDCCEDPECSAQALWVDTVMGTRSSNAVLRAARQGWNVRRAKLVELMRTRKSRCENIAISSMGWVVMRNYANAEARKWENRMKKLLDMKNPYEPGYAEKP